jgi:(2Fe-2S) ferredoxin
MIKKILICTNHRANLNNPSCAGRGSQQIRDMLRLALDNIGLKIMIEQSPCMGFCDIGPNLRLVPNGQFFHEVSANKIASIVKAAKKFNAN